MTFWWFQNNGYQSAAVRASNLPGKAVNKKYGLQSVLQFIPKVLVEVRSEFCAGLVTFFYTTPENLFGADLVHEEAVF